MLTRILVIISFAGLLVACDVLVNRKHLRLAYSPNEYLSDFASPQLKEFLEQGGYRVELIQAKSMLDACALVERGDADITLFLNHFNFNSSSEDTSFEKLRTLIPLFETNLFIFSKDSSIHELDNKSLTRRKVAVDYLEGVSAENLRELIRVGEYDSVDVVSDKNADFYFLWGNYTGARIQDFIKNEFTITNLNSRLSGLLKLSWPSVVNATLPMFHGKSIYPNFNTLSSQVLLVCSADLSEKTCYFLSEYIFRYKRVLSKIDSRYYHINEEFSQRDLLFPVHRGADAYLRRDRPGFLERYADLLAMIVSMIFVVYSGVRNVRDRIELKKKVRVQEYLIDFIHIRENNGESKIERLNLLNNLFQKLLKQMAESKNERNDFSTLSRILQQEISALK